MYPLDDGRTIAVPPYVNATPAPWRHQLHFFDYLKARRWFALLMEQRTGKTWVALALAAHHYHHHTLRTLVVVAYPNGVHRNWITDEIPKHLHRSVPRRCVAWNAARAKSKAYSEELDALAGFSGLAVITLNSEALLTDSAVDYVKRLLRDRPGTKMMLADESEFMANPSAKVTNHLLWFRDKVDFAGILSGTPFVESPLEAFSQMRFLSPRILGYENFTLFKRYYAELAPAPWERPPPGAPATWRPRIQIVARDDEGRPRYKHLDELHRRVFTVAVRVLRSEVSDAPPKVYQKRYFDLAPEQRKVYDDLRRDHLALLGSGRTVTAAMTLTRLLRLQQVASNYWPPEDDPEEHAACGGAGCEHCSWLGLVVVERPLEPIVPPAKNPRLLALFRELERTRGQVVIWARFRPDVDAIVAALGPNQVARLDGATPPGAERDAAKNSFRSGAKPFCVSNPAVGGRGYDFSNADTMLYYNCSYSLRLRLQSEDRGEGVLKTRSTDIVDLIADDTRDEPIINALVAKKDIADLVHGDPPREWIG